MRKKKPRTVTASDHDHADGAALTLLFVNEHILLHLSLFVYLSFFFVGGGGGSGLKV